MNCLHRRHNENGTGRKGAERRIFKLFLPSYSDKLANEILTRNRRQVIMIVGFITVHYRLKEHLRKLWLVVEVTAEHIHTKSHTLAGTRRLHGDNLF